MPLSTLYRVVTRYETDTSRAERRVERLTRRAELHAKAVERAKLAWTAFSITAKTVVFGGLTLGVGLLTSRMFSLTKAAQDANIQIAAVFEQANPGNFAGNLKRAEDLFKRFQKSAITSPATSQEFLQLFTGAAPGLAPLGLTNDVIDKFISRAVPTAVAFTGGDFEQAGRDILQILQGRAGTDVKTFNSLKARLFELTGARDTEAFNKLAQAQPNKVFDALNKALESMDVVNQEFAGSFGGLIASVQEFGDMFLRTIGGPVIRESSRLLQKMATWFQENEDRVRDLGEAIGEKFANGLRVVEKLTLGILENFRAIAVITSAIAAKKLVSGAGFAASLVGGGARNLLGGNLAAAQRISAGIGAGVKRAPGALAGGAASLVGEMLFGGMFGPRQDKISKGARGLKAAATRQWLGGGVTFETLEKGAGAFKGKALSILSAGLPAIGAGFATLATVLVPLTVIIGMIAGTFRVLKDEANEATIFFRTSVDELMIALDTIAIQFGQSGGFVDGLKKLVDWLGTGVVGALGIGVKIVERLATAFSYLFAMFKGIALGIGAMITKVQTEGLSAAFSPGFVKKAFSSGMAQAMEERRQAEIQAYREKQRREKQKKQEEEQETAAAGGKPAPKIDVTINQTITTDANPDRIAFRVGEVIGDVMKKFPKEVAAVGAR